MARAAFSESPLWSIRDDTVEKMELKTKLIVVSHLLFGSSFREGVAPFQDFSTLVRIRNDVTHWKMDFAEPKYLPPLVQRGIAISHPDSKSGHGDYPWPSKLSTLQGIRWAHNVACQILRALHQLVPAEKQTEFDFLIAGAEEISEQAIEKALAIPHSPIENA
ncbi:hypothetical protein CMV30_05490 [Nibricoccus aquaticus]|uniref:Uncharacterized protein n=2 Tax=Nibricoccus aquaticus TaxID=2576891 RepID=A0A290QDP3_9BACT|nr:hypothetical protein CMV30_05490 [Nibricoccus aquaticus]